jgi:protoporphyrinogen oxidase
MKTRHTSEYLIIGAGPTGLGAACRLQEMATDWHLLEAESHFGGLSASFVDENGFTWDLGGHVLFSHYETFDRYMRRAIPADQWLSHHRESWIWIRDRFVPYPFQNNLHRLPPPERWACVQGLLAAHRNTAHQGKPKHFADWMTATMGSGITDLFLRPYNQKVWAYPPEKMDSAWVGERVSVPSLDQALKAICTERDEVSWGPNQKFLFPREGGTGSIWKSLGSQLPAERITLGCRVTHIDIRTKTVHTSDGGQRTYNRLISSLPLNQLLRLAPGVADPQLAGNMLYSTTHVIGVGVRGQPPSHIASKCWMYFPEANSPYYRATVFSNYSPHNVPQPAQQWSLMAEVAESPDKPVNRDTLSVDTIRALKEDRLLTEHDAICSLVVRTVPQGYPTPFLGRDSLIDPLLRRFEAADIFSRGRFGAWKYEVGNQDHSFAQGFECASRLESGGGADCEPTLFTPNLVNSRKNP